MSERGSAESEEAIAGFFLLELENLSEIARKLTALEYGATIEVRPVVSDCMVGESAQQRHARKARLHASAQHFGWCDR
jgi:hypothetical protein